MWIEIDFKFFTHIMKDYQKGERKGEKNGNYSKILIVIEVIIGNQKWIDNVVGETKSWTLYSLEKWPESSYGFREDDDEQQEGGDKLSKMGMMMDETIRNGLYAKKCVIDTIKGKFKCTKVAFIYSLENHELFHVYHVKSKMKGEIYHEK